MLPATEKSKIIQKFQMACDLIAGHFFQNQWQHEIFRPIKNGSHHFGSGYTFYVAAKLECIRITSYPAHFIIQTPCFLYSLFAKIKMKAK